MPLDVASDGRSQPVVVVVVAWVPMLFAALGSYAFRLGSYAVVALGSYAFRLGSYAFRLGSYAVVALSSYAFSPNRACTEGFLLVI